MPWMVPRELPCETSILGDIQTYTAQCDEQSVVLLCPQVPSSLSSSLTLWLSSPNKWLCVGACISSGCSGFLGSLLWLFQCQPHDKTRQSVVRIIALFLRSFWWQRDVSSKPQLNHIIPTLFSSLSHLQSRETPTLILFWRSTLLIFDSQGLWCWLLCMKKERKKAFQMMTAQWFPPPLSNANNNLKLAFYLQMYFRATSEWEDLLNIWTFRWVGWRKYGAFL